MRRLLLFTLLGALALSGGTSTALATAGSTGQQPSFGSLVVPGLEILNAQQGTLAARRARHADPGAVAARAVSRGAYGGLSASAAARVAREAFPEVLADEPSGPIFNGGEHVTRYLSDHAANVALGQGRHAVLESSVPIDTADASGRRVALDLSLRANGDAFEPTTAAADVRIPQRLGDGVTLTSSGIRLTPVTSQVGDAGAIDGSTVIFANTLPDADTLVKPVAEGVAVDAVLRSPRSPESFSFRVSGPGAVKLRQSSAGPVEVYLNGALLAIVSPPSAQDAAGTDVPVSMSVAGDLVKLAVEHRSGDFQYPIEVDPTVVDARLVTESYFHTHWRVDSFNGKENPFYFATKGTAAVDYDPGTGTYAVGNWGAYAYETQGVSRIYEWAAETSASNAGSNMENRLLLQGETKGTEAQTLLPGSYGLSWIVVCPGACDNPAAGSAHNAAEFLQVATATGNSFESRLARVEVLIAQDTAPTVGADTTDATIGGQQNVAVKGAWLSPYSGVYGVSAKDPGLGISQTKYRAPALPSWAFTESLISEGAETCEGVQCKQTYTGAISAEQNPGGTPLPEGNTIVEVTGSNATGLGTTASLEIKVDRTGPHDLAISGLPANGEIGDGVYTLKATATDGSGKTPSSGVAPISITVDGVAVGKAQGGCSVGPCTTTGEWMISGSEFAVGQHTLRLSAPDNSGNPATKDMLLFVTRPVTPVAVGPGNVNPESGELNLSGVDVSITGSGGALTVGRSYGSQHLTAGSEGPLGPEWSLDLGGSQSLIKLPNGSVLLTSGDNLQSVFTPKAGGEFTAPKGDANLKLVESTVESKVQFKLSANGGSATTFTLPAGGTGNTWVPTSEAGPGNTSVTTSSYQVVGGIIEPTEVLGPVPANVTCTTTLVRGCRALRFVYGASTTATGEGLSQWGDFVGRLKQVTFTAWDPATSAMSTTAVAQYSYDKLGRLRAEWDPRVSPAVKTTYGYDAGDRVSAAVPAGEQPWLFSYGTASGDIRTGHLLSATRPAPTTAAGPGLTPVNTAAPTLSPTNGAEGKTLTVSNGTWSNTPLAYSYQWQECSKATGVDVCEPIPGATNQTYVSVYHSPNHWLTAQVAALNANGGSSAVTGPTSTVLPDTYMEKSIEFAPNGSSAGQVSGPVSMTTDSSGNVWVADTGNNRIEKFSSAGAFIASYGSVGSGLGQYKSPCGIAIDTAGNVWIADTGNSRVQELTSAGALLSVKTLKDAPFGIAVLGSGSTGSVYVADLNNSISYYHGAPAASMLLFGTIGGAGTGNGQFNAIGGLAVDEGTSMLYASDTGNHRVQAFNVLGGSFNYASQFGSSGSGEGQFSAPKGVGVEAGNVFVADSTLGRVQKFLSSAVLDSFTDTGAVAVTLYPKATAGSMYVIGSTLSNKITKWVTATRPVTPPAPPNPGTSSVWTVEYDVPVSGTGAPYAMASTDVAKWGQTDIPVEAMAVLPPDSPQGWPATSYKRATVHYLDSDGREVNKASPGGNISTTEYNSKNDVVRTLSGGNRLKALAEGAKAAEVSHLLDTQSTYSEDGSEVLTTTGPQHTVKLPSGSQVLARHKTKYFYDEGAPGSGGPYHLVTKLTEGALLTGGTEEDVHTTVNSYAGQEGLGWKLHAPTSITTDPTGLKIVRTKLYDATTGAVTDAIMPAGNQAGGDSHDTQTIYYTALANAKVAACGLHPEWAEMPCQTKLAKNPETAGVPNPPVTTQTYNLWDQSLEASAVVGADTRKLVQVYDAAGRPQSATMTSTVGTALPTVKFTYDSASGKLSTSSATEGATTRTITSVFDKWGQMESYTDADGVKSSYTYDVDGRPATGNDGKGTQTYGYDATSGLPSSLVDSATSVGAAYNADGSIKEETFANGMVEKYTYDATGQLTGIEYVKTTNCASKCVWYSDAVVPSISGQWLTRSSTLSSQAYKYDTASRLTQVQDTPTGEGCTTRLYGYDADGNRTSQTTRSPGAGGVCATEGGTTVNHSYDAADRLLDSGSTYDAFGNSTSVPAGDAGGTTLTSTFFVSGKVASQTQNGQTNGYHLDPAGRQRELVATGTKALTSVMHYSGGGDTPSWTAEGATGWTRDVVGPGGSLVATQTNGEAPVLQITNLHGDVVATASISETATSLASTTDTTEYGVPRTGSPPKYSWLGGSQRVTSLASGVVSMGARSYIPQIGRFLQTDPVEGGSANAYSYASGDPVNTSDASGESSFGLSTWLHEQNNQIGKEVAAREAAREAAARAEAERIAAEAAMAAAMAAGEYQFPADWIDPDHSLAKLNGVQAMSLATGIRAGGEIAEQLIGQFLGPLGEIVAKLAHHFLDGFAQSLENCSLGTAGWPGRAMCEVVLHTMETPWGWDTMWPNPANPISVDACYWVKKGGRFHKRGWNCSPIGS